MGGRRKICLRPEIDESGLGGDVRFRAAAMGRSTTYTLRYYYGVILSELLGGKLRATLQKN